MGAMKNCDYIPTAISCYNHSSSSNISSTVILSMWEEKKLQLGIFIHIFRNFNSNFMLCLLHNLFATSVVICIYFFSKTVEIRIFKKPKRN